MSSTPRFLAPAIALGLAVLGTAAAAPAWAAAPAASHIVVSQSNLKRSYSCGSGDSVTVNGHNDKLQFKETCSTLTVTSYANVIEVNKVSSITFTSGSSGNFVCWKHGSPKVHNHGTANSVGPCTAH